MAALLILTFVEEGQPLVGGALVADIVVARTLLGPEAGLVLGTGLLAADLVAFAFADAEDAAVGR